MPKSSSDNFAKNIEAAKPYSDKAVIAVIIGRIHAILDRLDGIEHLMEADEFVADRLNGIEERLGHLERGEEKCPLPFHDGCEPPMHRVSGTAEKCLHGCGLPRGHKETCLEKKPAEGKSVDYANGYADGVRDTVKGIREREDKPDLPMGYSAWKNQGERYGYITHFIDTNGKGEPAEATHWLCKFHTGNKTSLAWCCCHFPNVYCTEPAEDAQREKRITEITMELHQDMGDISSMSNAEAIVKAILALTSL